MVWWCSGALSADPSGRILSWYHYWSEMISCYCYIPIWWMQWRWDEVMCMNSGMSLGSLITATNSAHTLLWFTQIWRLQVHLFHIGRENPTVYTSASAVPTWSMWSTLLPQPRLRWTAMWAFPSNIDQRLASGHPLTGNYFFSSLMLDDNSYLSVAVCLAHWCGGGGHHGILAKKAWRGGCDCEYRTGAARVDFLTDA